MAQPWYHGDTRRCTIETENLQTNQAKTLVDEVRVVAKAQKRTITAIVTLALEEYIQRHKENTDE